MNDPSLKSAERELLDALKRGETPSWDEFASRYPHDLDSLRQLFDRLLEVEPPVIRSPTRYGTTDNAGEADTSNIVSESVSGITHDIYATTYGKPLVANAASRLPREFGAYELLDELARGGMGVVFRARQVKLNRLVALKMILSGEFADVEQVRRFYAEAKAAAALDHPGIVPVIEVGEHGGQHFFSMGLVDGTSLDVTIQDQSLSQRDCVVMLRQITDAVAYAHGQGVIHRDLKPANVLIDTSGQPRVTDFGLAKRVSGESRMTATGQVMGTPNYMPPEQATGRTEEIGVTADIYSLGAILYEMLVGRPPFRGSTAIETLRQVIESELVEPSRLNHAIDRDLETICLKCLAKEPRERYPTAAALSAELQRYLDGSPIEARRIGRATRTLRWCRRRPLQTGLIAASLMLVGLFVALLTANRHAAKVTQISELKSVLNAQVRSTDTFPENIAGLEATVATLRILDPFEADAADKKLTREIADHIDRDLRTSEISDGGARFRDAIDWVRSRDSVAAQRLDASLRARLADWRELVRLTAPHHSAQAQNTLGIPSLQVATDAISRPASSSEQVLFGERCPSSAEIEATFVDGWRNAAEIGLLLNASDDRGYAFVLRAGKKHLRNPNSTPSDGEESITDELVLEVRKAGRLLQQSRMPATLLSGDTLSLRARRERGQISFQVNNQPPIEIRDVFATSAATSGRFGLIWPASVKLTSLRTQSRELPAQPRPVEQADALFDDRNIDAALEIYDRLARNSESPEMQAEADYKAAVCLVELKRQSEAASRLEQVRASRIDPWGLLASCQAWLLNIRKGELDKADAIQDQLAAVYSFEQLAAAVPSDQRQEILRSVFRRDLSAESAADLVQLERAMSLDRFLSIDGRGDLNRQIDCVKAVEKSGRLDHAQRLLLKLVDAFPRNPYPYYRLSMLARCNGDFTKSLAYSNRGITILGPETNPIDIGQLRLERIRTNTALGNFDQALGEAEELESATRSVSKTRAQSVEAQVAVWATLSHLALIRGFIVDERGDLDKAVAIWRKGYFDTRQAIGAVDAGQKWLILNVMILGSLSNELKAADATGVVVELSGAAMPQQLVRMGVGQFGEDVLHQTLLKMWQRPDARRIARDGYALHRLSYKDRLTVPIVIAGAELVRQTAFSDDLVGSQKELIQLAISDLVSLIESKRIGMMDVVGFGIAWKAPGDRGQPLEPLVGRLPDRSKPLAAYIIAHRLAKTNAKKQEVRRWLELAAVNLGENKVAAAQIGDELAELKSDQGVLKLVNPLQREVKVEWTGPGGETAVHSLEQTRTWKLPAGSYRVRMLDGSGASLSSESVSLQPLAPQTLTVQTLWAPGSEAATWPGAIIRSAKLPGIRKWQLFNREPVTDIRHLVSSPDNQVLAAGGRDGVVRIYRTSDRKLIHLLPGHAENLTSLTWSADGKFLMSTAYDYLVQVWQMPDAKLAQSFTPSTGFCDAAISPDGLQIALGQWDGVIQICDRTGVPKQKYSAHVGRIESLKWSGDGSELISCNQHGHLIVRSVANSTTQLDHQYDSPINLCLSPDQSQLGVAEFQGGSIDLIDTASWQTIRTVETPLTSVNAFDWTGQGNDLVVLSNTGEILICDPDADANEPRFKAKAHPASVITRLGDEQFAVLTNQFTVEMWDSTLSESELLFSAKYRGVAALQWHPTRNLVAVGFSDGNLSCFDAAGKRVAVAQHDASIHSLAWSADGQRLAVGLRSGEVHVYQQDLANKQSLERHTSIAEVIWSSDGKLLTGAPGSELREYKDLQQPHRIITKLKGGFRNPIQIGASNLLYRSNDARLHCIDWKEPNNIFTIDRQQRIYGEACDYASGTVAMSFGNNIELFEMSRSVGAELQSIKRWNFGATHFRDIAWNTKGDNLYALSNDGRLVSLDREGQILTTLPVKDQLTPDSFVLSSDDALVATATYVPLVTVHNLTEVRAMFSIVALNQGRTLTFFPGGYSADSLDGVDDELVCVTMDDEGIVQMHRPTEFFDR
ncbi:protein kinase domain-containing protein [Rosistilla oblonga]|uniref:protein kinase domain-containing protein n=1 Tax=Rosistilla oblonga TaxID=2527990 RepID=UPI003A9706F1